MPSCWGNYSRMSLFHSHAILTSFWDFDFRDDLLGLSGLQLRLRTDGKVSAPPIECTLALRATSLH